MLSHSRGHGDAAGRCREGGQAPCPGSPTDNRCAGGFLAFQRHQQKVRASPLPQQILPSKEGSASLRIQHGHARVPSLLLRKSHNSGSRRSGTPRGQRPGRIPAPSRTDPAATIYQPTSAVPAATRSRSPAPTRQVSAEHRAAARWQHRRPQEPARAHRGSGQSARATLRIASSSLLKPAGTGRAPGSAGGSRAV